MWRKARKARHAAGEALAHAPLELSAVVDFDPDEERRPRLSLLRTFTAVVVIGGAGYGGFLGVRAKVTATATTRPTTWFAPYVDVTLSPTYQFQSPSSDPARQTALGFVVASSSHACAPSWGAAYGLAQANQRLALSARIAQLQGDGAHAIVSFGGAAHTSLAVACATPVALARAYQSVIDTYHLRTIDLDVEGAALADVAARERRAQAVRLLERAATRAHRPLEVWLTLPVEPSGLQDNALSVVASMFRARVRLAGINVMAMNFSAPPAPGSTMLDLVEGSLQATEAQLARFLPRYGIHLDAAQIWQRLGVTVMIGQNDVAGEQFGVGAALRLRSFARAAGVARVSIWSINRDQPCGAGYGVAVLSNTCSGTGQAGLQFTTLLSHLDGTTGARGGAASPVLRPVAPDTSPAAAPFPAWNPQASYVTGYKVTEHGQIFQAKWYNSGQDPGAQFQHSWQSPWELLGPVLRGDHAPAIATPPAGTYPAWSATALYVAGQRVLYQRLPYQAKWSNEGVTPGIAASQQPSSPWAPLFTIPGEPGAG